MAELIWTTACLMCFAGRRRGDLRGQRSTSPGLTDTITLSVVTSLLQQPHQLPYSCGDRLIHTWPDLQLAITALSNARGGGCHGNRLVPMSAVHNRLAEDQILDVIIV